MVSLKLSGVSTLSSTDSTGKEVTAKASDVTRRELGSRDRKGANLIGSQ